MWFKITPIGIVEKLDEHKSHIKFFKKYANYLDQIESFSHILVLYWLSKVPRRLRRGLKIKPKIVKTPPLGVFATRFPARPNPIGITTVKLLSRRGNLLIVEGLDAEDRTPVIDIKPYMPIFDKPSGRVKLPTWVLEHIKRHHTCHSYHHTHHHQHSFKEILELVELE